MKLKVIFIVILGVVIGTIIGLVGLWLINSGVFRGDGVPTESDANQVMLEDKSLYVDIIDADAYYEQNSKVLFSIESGKSKDVLSEKEIISDFEDRGFFYISFTKDNYANNEFIDTTEIDSDSEEKHPEYRTYYSTDNGEFWTIISTNGKVVANPVSYNMQSELSVQVIISESESICCYDNHTGKFYETIPNSDVLIVKVVEKINADTLDSLTVEEIDKL